MIIVNLQLKAKPETLAEFMDWFAGEPVFRFLEVQEVY